MLKGLEKLEYRGYDSAGIAVYDGSGLEIYKSKGRLKILSDMIEGGAKVKGTVGIGHTRWATHGEPSDINSHPQVSDSGRFAVVHNGIIENYLEIKEHLMRQGVHFTSDTDTEVVAQLLEFHYNECHNMLELWAAACGGSRGPTPSASSVRITPTPSLPPGRTAPSSSATVRTATSSPPT